MSKYIVYVIESKEGYKYTGMTTDIALRIKQHNEKSLSFWTKRGTEWKLVYKEELDSISKALSREKWLKTGVGREYLKNKLKRL